MAHKLGLQAKLYFNNGTYESPDWQEISNAKDVTLSLESSEADVTTRANGGWRATVGALKDAAVEFQMVWDPADTAFTKIRDAWLNGAGLELLVLDGDKDTAGNQGLRATFAITRLNRNEPLEDAITVDVSAKPTYADHAPEWVTMPLS